MFASSAASCQLASVSPLQAPASFSLWSVDSVSPDTVTQLYNVPTRRGSKSLLHPKIVFTTQNKVPDRMISPPTFFRILHQPLGVIRCCFDIFCQSTIRIGYMCCGSGFVSPRTFFAWSSPQLVGTIYVPKRVHTNINIKRVMVNSGVSIMVNGFVWAKLVSLVLMTTTCIRDHLPIHAMHIRAEKVCAVSVTTHSFTDVRRSAINRTSLNGPITLLKNSRKKVSCPGARFSHKP
jgi:hypothetical protein